MFDWLRRLFGLDNVLGGDFWGGDSWGDPDEPHIPGFDVVDTNAELSHSKRISGIFCRWHSRDLLPTAAPLWKSFMDDERKWSSQGRFAGANRNCGHFFAVNGDHLPSAKP
jgi:hypothetical protein